VSAILDKVNSAIESFNQGKFETLANACNFYNANLHIANIEYSNSGIFTPDFFVDEKTAQERLAKCLSCAELSDSTITIPHTCTLCDCQVHVISTMVLKKCPKGEW